MGHLGQSGDQSEEVDLRVILVNSGAILGPILDPYLRNLMKPVN